MIQMNEREETTVVILHRERYTEVTNYEHSVQQTVSSH